MSKNNFYYSTDKEKYIPIKTDLNQKYYLPTQSLDHQYTYLEIKLK